MPLQQADYATNAPAFISLSLHILTFLGCRSVFFARRSPSPSSRTRTRTQQRAVQGSVRIHHLTPPAPPDLGGGPASIQQLLLISAQFLELLSSSARVRTKIPSSYARRIGSLACVAANGEPDVHAVPMFIHMPAVQSPGQDITPKAKQRRLDNSLGQLYFRGETHCLSVSSAACGQRLVGHGPATCCWPMEPRGVSVLEPDSRPIDRHVMGISSPWKLSTQAKLCLCGELRFQQTALLS